MTKIKPVNIASLMMLLWLVISFFFPERWAAFSTIIACGAPMVLFKHSIRGNTFGARDCNTVIYKKHEYALFFTFCISGAAFISAVTFLITKSFGTVTVSAAPRSDFLYLLVFSCMIPAFFEEWLMRGGVLGAVAKHGGAGVWFCAILFMLMHMDLAKWPYALFAGLCLTALVYLTECIYLGMLLHFLNNFISLILSYLPSGIWEYITLFVVAVVFIISARFLKETKLCKDAVKLIGDAGKEKIKEMLTPLFWVFAALVVAILLWANAFLLMLPSQ